MSFMSVCPHALVMAPLSWCGGACVLKIGTWVEDKDVFFHLPFKWKKYAKNHRLNLPRICCPLVFLFVTPSCPLHPYAHHSTGSLLHSNSKPCIYDFLFFTCQTWSDSVLLPFHPEPEPHPSQFVLLNLQTYHHRKQASHKGKDNGRFFPTILCLASMKIFYWISKRMAWFVNPEVKISDLGVLSF